MEILFHLIIHQILFELGFKKWKQLTKANSL